MYSVLILTYNEEINIEECIKSVKHSDDIVILDSCSSDNTLTISQKYNLRIFSREFDNYGSQRNYALNEIEYKNKWLLMLDADERLTEDFEEEVITKLQNIKDEVSLIRFRRKDFLLGKWLRRSSGYPTWFGRIIKIGSVKVIREVNEEYHTDGGIEYIQEHILHFPFNKGIDYWIERHNKYSSMEAIRLRSELAVNDINYLRIFSGDPVLRRKILKQIFYRLPFRSFLVFLYLYFFKLGFLDGYPGFIFCRLRSLYESMIVIKMKKSNLLS